MYILRLYIEMQNMIKFVCLVIEWGGMWLNGIFVFSF